MRGDEPLFLQRSRWRAGARVPRMRGDEPEYPLRNVPPELSVRVPRMRGDEPSWPFMDRVINPAEFPACAGMNRCGRRPAHARSRVPRMRGDEPAFTPKMAKSLNEFPACAGMNRWTLVTPGTVRI